MAQKPKATKTFRLPADTTSFRTPQNDKRAPWDRGVSIANVYPTLSEVGAKPAWSAVPDNEIEEIKAQHNDQWKGYVVRLHQPIWVASDPLEVIDTGLLRLYPPFRIDRHEIDQGAVEKIAVPNPSPGLIGLPDYVPRAMAANVAPEGTAMCYGLRLDLLKGVEHFDILQAILQKIREFTYQWWLSAAHDPFDYGYKFEFLLDKSYNARSPLKYQGAGSAEGTWGAMASSQYLLGVEKPVSSTEWRQIAASLKSNTPKERASHFLLQAIASYMAKQDESCLMELCISMEIMECNCRVMETGKAKGHSLRLMKGAQHWIETEDKVIEKMFKDRGHVAHGKRPRYIGQDTAILKKYLDVTLEHFNRYIEKAAKYGWERLANL